MKNECAIVRDLLPLYVEGMASEASKRFVKEHISECGECAEELKKIQWSNEQIHQEGTEAILELKTLKRKLRNRKYRSIVLTVLCLLMIAGAVYYFPVYRIITMETPTYFKVEELGLLAYIGSAEERNIANNVLARAEEAFRDISHSREENKERYGVLSRYAVEGTRGAVGEQHSLELWSARIRGDQGWMWVYYSQKAFDEKGNTVSGSWRIESLWQIARDEQGVWQVVSIKEHP